MRNPSRLPLAAAAALAAGAPPVAAQTLEVPVCESREAAQMVMQAGPGARLPDGCRLATVRRLDTPAGPVCVIDITGRGGGGLAGAVTEAIATTEWWTGCANLRTP